MPVFIEELTYGSPPPDFHRDLLDSLDAIAELLDAEAGRVAMGGIRLIAKGRVGGELPGLQGLEVEYHRGELPGVPSADWHELRFSCDGQREVALGYTATAGYELAPNSSENPLGEQSYLHVLYALRQTEWAAEDATKA